MGGSDPVVESVERESEDVQRGTGERDINKEEDVEKGEVGLHQNLRRDATETNPPPQFRMSRMDRLSNTNPLRLVINSATRVATPSPAASYPRATPSQAASYPHATPSPAASSYPRTTPSPAASYPYATPSPADSYPRATPSPAQPRPTPTPPQQSVRSLNLNSRTYTNKLFLLLFLLHMVAAFGLVCFLIFKGIQGLLLGAGSTKRKEKRVLQYFLPQVEAASLLSITLAFVWQKALRTWPAFMVHFILWSTFLMSLSAGILLICFQKPATDGVGVLFIIFAIGNGLYACWVTTRIKFCTKVLTKSLEPVSKLAHLNQPTYCMLGAGFIWMSLCILAVIGSLNFYLTPLVIIALVLSLCWTTEVMRNVANITVSRVIALYYLRGMQSNTQVCLIRGLSNNLGSACLGSLFVPAIEALRVVARGLNLLEGEDEFMFSCAHCCLRVMESIFRCGNGWAYVQIAAYGKGFVQASRDTWELFEKQEMAAIVDSDMTTALCFLTGVCSGSMCVIMVAAWTVRVHQGFTATISLLAFFVGYLMTRIGMALPHACVSCYYVCYAEAPENRMFDNTISDRLNMMKSGRDVVAPTPRIPRRFTT
ncbi:protein PNS1 [Diospyros lotus]|uniref:protein PNS1 n=1 Tax=Diospyros lotus TaxID=55363 RepID=UPI002256A530|nr:protein PNS1 [Diospyros lotus]